ncbi:MAG: hypothetical protein LBN09_06055 [Clostridioides sp.]|jgi:hypothetical protein|nr:hypothetical protein [Clostridioides sp.]
MAKSEIELEVRNQTSRSAKESGVLLKLAFLLEKTLALVVLITICFGIFDLLRLVWQEYIVDFNHIVQYNTLNTILAQALLLVIGVELVVMLSLHIPGAFIEALLYAIARKMLLLPKADGMIEVLMGVVAMAGLFAIRKYLIPNGTYISEADKSDSHLDKKTANEINKKYAGNYKFMDNHEGGNE